MRGVLSYGLAFCEVISGFVGVFSGGVGGDVGFSYSFTFTQKSHLKNRKTLTIIAVFLHLVCLTDSKDAMVSTK